MRQSFLFYVLPFFGLNAALAGPPAKPTGAQRAWIAEHSVVRVSSEQNGLPFSFRGADGSPRCVSMEYVRLLAEKAGLGFVTPRPRRRLLEMAKLREWDRALKVARTEDRSRYLRLSPAYAGNPVAVFARKTEAPAETGDWAGQRQAGQHGSFLFHRPLRSG